MRKLTVLYDASCGFCIRCRHWLEEQPQLLELDFVPARSTEATRRFPSLGKGDEPVVVSDEGDVYRDAHAWVMCLYALRDYREWSLRLAEAGLLPMARSVFEWVSGRRKGLSRWAGSGAAVGRNEECRRKTTIPRERLREAPSS